MLKIFFQILLFFIGVVLFYVGLFIGLTLNPTIANILWICSFLIIGLDAVWVIKSNGKKK